MPEVALAGEDHRHAVLVGGGDRPRVAHRAARLDHGGDARLRGLVDAVAEREERVGREDRSRERPRAFATAMRTESTRDIWPAPMPRVRPPGREDDGVGLDVLADAPGEVEIAQLLGVGARFVTTFAAGGGGRVASRVWTRKPPATLRSSSAPGRARGAMSQTSRRRFFLPRAVCSASGVEDGAITHSRNVSLELARQLAVDGRLTATMPPNAETGSVSRARR